MDPKLSQTDPKLQEAYDKVMSGPVAPPPPVSGGVIPTPQPFAPVTPAATQPSPVPMPMAPSPTPAPFATPQPVTPQSTAPVTPSPSTMGSTLAFNANNAGKNQGTTVKRGGSKVMSLIVGLGIIVILVAYTFVWIYVFKLQIPFLPKF